MTHPEGGFFSAQDAEVDGVEGASYVWSRAEIEAVLGEDASNFLSVYRLAPMSEQPGKGVLRVELARVDDAAALLQRLSPQRAELLAARNRRAQPLRDEKVLAGWNGLAIRALVDAAEILKRPEYIRLAERAAHFVLERLGTSEGGLRRSYIAGQAREEGVLNDYAFLADGLLALHGATGDPSWLQRASTLVDTMLDRFEDEEGGGFYFSGDDPTLLLRPKTFEDGALPAGNAVALRTLRLLGDLKAELRYEQSAERTTQMLASGLEQAPSVMGTAIVALAAPRTKSSTPPPRARQAAGSGVRSLARLPRSDDHVRVGLERDPREPRTLVVRLSIDEGWHVNANPASLPFLIPTAVELSDGVQMERIHYPPGIAFQPAFSDEALSVYEGHVAVRATLPAEFDGTSPSVAVRYQACDHQRCLPPAVSHAELTEKDREAR